MITIEKPNIFFFCYLLLFFIIIILHLGSFVMLHGSTALSLAMMHRPVKRIISLHSIDLI